ncbi:hypothetical protein ABZX40_14875 [Streptomyces sp. NPDC004610]|uniref:hypothetical protein n=1 Tax=Streptomyces sp. NPDC004610 TaxID=3154668 RepID=UPI0033BE7E19
MPQVISNHLDGVDSPYDDDARSPVHVRARRAARLGGPLWLTGPGGSAGRRGH